MDPALKRSAKTYRRFVADLHRRGLLTWTRRPLCQVGLFFVEKDNGRQLRLILDARPANELFLPPPGVSLLLRLGAPGVHAIRESYLDAAEAFGAQQRHTRRRQKELVGRSCVQDKA